MADIKQLTDREHCRSRTGMYLGSKSDDGSPNAESLRTSIREACDNSKDELLVGNGDTIWIFVDKKEKEPLGLIKYEDKSIKDYKEWYRYTCADNASGIPIKSTKNTKGEEITMTELAVGNFRAGSKFNKDVAIVGLNGIGVSATNFTSAVFTVYSRLSCHDLTKTTKYIKKLIIKNGITKNNSKDWYYKITYNLGLKVSEELTSFKKDDLLQKYWGKSNDKPSTVTTFIPDPTIHGTTVADVPDDFSYLGYLNKDFKFYINGKKISSDIGFDFTESVKIGIDGKVYKKGKDYTSYTKTDEVKNPWVELNYSIGLTNDFKEKPIERYSVNTLECAEGKHKNIFKLCWTKAFCDYFDDWDIEKYTMEGLNVLFIWRCPEPAFSSQTKERCSSVDGWGNKLDQYELLVKSFTKTIKENEDVFKAQYDRIRELYNAKQNIGKLKELQGMLSSITKGDNRSSSAFMPRKLLDCSPKAHQKDAEIYFCEGDSASGGFIKARAGMNNIAVLPLRGKITNVVGLDTNTCLDNAEIYDITHVCGGVNEVHIPIEKLRYSKYIIASDEDSDGCQIAALLLGLFLQNHTFLFGTPENDYEDSRVYKVKGALYGFFDIDGKKGTHKYFYAGEEKLVSEFQKNHTYKKLQRWKGLGELTPQELRDMYLNRDTRKLIKIKPEDIEQSLNIVGTSEAKKELMLKNNVITLDTIDLGELYGDNKEVESTIKESKRKKQSKSRK